MRIFNTILMIGIFTILFACAGCSVGSASAGYAMRAGTADDVSSKCRQEIVTEVLQRLGRERAK